MGISSATVRNVMADLEDQGFLESPHCSSGRVPTEKTLSLYAQSLVSREKSLPLSQHDVSVLDSMEHSQGAMDQVSQTLADLCQCAGVFFSAPQDPVIVGLKFLPLSPGKAVSILETSCKKTEHRVISIPIDTSQQDLNQAAEYLNALVFRRNVHDALNHVEQILRHQTEHLRVLALHLLRNGVYKNSGALDIKGHSYLLNTIRDIRGIGQFKNLFAWIEKQKMFSEMLQSIIHTRRLQIFFGHDDGFANFQGCSVVMAPYQAERNKGVVGVIGPLHMDYRRVIPIIDGMAKIVERTFQ
jgi:heat-inducible transcriptional repressor